MEKNWPETVKILEFGLDLPKENLRERIRLNMGTLKH